MDKMSQTRIMTAVLVLNVQFIYISYLLFEQNKHSMIVLPINDSQVSVTSNMFLKLVVCWEY